MCAVNLSETSAAEITKAGRIAERAGVNLRDCYQCGKCSAGCPMSDEMDAPPQKIIHMLQMGLANKALSARGPWMCAQCLTCTSRCPQNIEVASLMREVRMTSHDEGRAVVPESEKFEKLFIDGVASKGKSNEQYLAAKFNLSSGHFTQDLGIAPKMMTNGLIGVAAHSSRNPKLVRRLIERCEESTRRERSSE